MGRVGKVPAAPGCRDPPRVPGKKVKKIFSRYSENQDIWISDIRMFYCNTPNRFADFGLRIAHKCVLAVGLHPDPLRAAIALPSPPSRYNGEGKEGRKGLEIGRGMKGKT